MRGCLANGTGAAVGLRPLVLALLLVGLALGCAPARDAPRVAEGALDLRGWSFAEQGIVVLDGEWRVCWNALLEPGEACPSEWQGFPVPRLWSDASVSPPIGGRGVATYRAQVRLPEAPGALALRAGSPFTAWRLWINGRLRGEVGRVGVRPEEVVAKLENHRFALPLDARELDVWVQVANFEFRGGGIRRPWYLGLADQVDRRDAYELALYTTFSATSVVLGLFFLAQFAFRPSEQVRAWFGLFALLIGVRILYGSASDLYQLIMGWAPFGLLIRLEYTNTALVIYTIGGYLLTKIPDVLPPFPTRVIRYAALALVPVQLLAPMDWVLATLPIVLALPPAGLVVALLSYGRATRRGVEGARATLVAIALFAIGALHDVVRTPTGLGAPIELFPYFVVGWMLLEAHSLLQSFAHTFARVEGLSEELREANFELQETEQAVVRFVPFDFLRTLGKESIREVRPGDHASAEMTVLACDLQIPEQHVPASTFALVRELLGRVEPLIASHGGFSSQQLGDRILALFPESADEAVAAALAIQRAAGELARQAPGAEASLELARVSIGVATGTVLVGTVGGEDSLSSVVVGQAVTLARRLQNRAREFEAGTLVSETTRKHMGERARYRFETLEEAGEDRAFQVREATAG